MSLALLALDLEGTLISNAMSQLPRPGLHAFLSFCLEAVPAVVIYTAVREARTRDILARLVAEGDAPAGLATLEIVSWSGPHKDLRWALPLARGPVTLEAARLVDDLAEYVLPGQEHLWIPIEQWGSPYPDTDRELARVQAVVAALSR